MRVDMSLVLVIRGGLWLGECLDVTVVGRNVLAETHPRTFVSDSSEISSWVTHTRRSSLIRALCRLHRQFLRIPELSLLPQTQDHGGDLAGQRDLRQLVFHASGERGFVILRENVRMCTWQEASWSWEHFVCLVEDWSLLETLSTAR